jgi:hypothetical protein
LSRAVGCRVWSRAPGPSGPRPYCSWSWMSAGVGRAGGVAGSDCSRRVALQPDGHGDSPPKEKTRIRDRILARLVRPAYDLPWPRRHLSRETIMVRFQRQPGVSVRAAGRAVCCSWERWGLQQGRRSRARPWKTTSRWEGSPRQGGGRPGHRRVQHRHQTEPQIPGCSRGAEHGTTSRVITTRRSRPPTRPRPRQIASSPTSSAASRGSRRTTCTPRQGLQRCHA